MAPKKRGSQGHSLNTRAGMKRAFCLLPARFRTQQSLPPTRSPFPCPPPLCPRRLRVASNLQQIQCFYIAEKNGTSGNQLTWVVFGGQVVTTAGWQVCAPYRHGCTRALKLGQAATASRGVRLLGITGTASAQTARGFAEGKINGVFNIACPALDSPRPLRLSPATSLALRPSPASSPLPCPAFPAP
jgi:hypothetical protein